MKLNNEQLLYLVNDQYLLSKGDGSQEDYDSGIDVKTVEDKYQSTGRHQEYHLYTFEHPNGKFYQVPYSTSTKDNMDWDACNYPPHECIEVIPVEKTIITYKALIND